MEEKVDLVVRCPAEEALHAQASLIARQRLPVRSRCRKGSPRE